MRKTREPSLANQGVGRVESEFACWRNGEEHWQHCTSQAATTRDRPSRYAFNLVAMRFASRTANAVAKRVGLA